MNKNLKNLTRAAILAAIIFLATAYLFHIPSPAGGYIHLGDMFIYISAILLPMPYAIAASAAGAALADITTGFAIYAVPTIIVKSLMCLSFTHKKNKFITTRNVVGAIIAGIVCIAGYYVADVIMSQNFIAPLSGAFRTSIQSIGNIVIFIALGLIFDKMKLKNRLDLNN